MDIRVGTPCLLLLALAACGHGGPATKRAATRTGGDLVSRVLARSPVIDGHNDLLIHYLKPDGSFAGIDSYHVGSGNEGQTDVERLRRGGVGAVVFTVGAPDRARRVEGLRTSTGLIRALETRHPDHFVVAFSASDVRSAMRRGRVAALMALEGAEQLDDAPTALEDAYALGVRSIGVAWNASNDFADAATDSARHGGLSARGRELVRNANRLGILVDLSHASDAAAAAAIATAAAPVILSHSSARALCPAPRNASDELLRLVRANGGIVMVTLVPYLTSRSHWQWFTAGEARWAELKAAHGPDTASARAAMERWERDHPEPAVSVTDVADHIDHVRAFAGVAHVGLGSDFDGMFSHIPGLDDVSTFPVLLRELAARGWTESELAGLTGGNFLRVLERAEQVASQARGR